MAWKPSIQTQSIIGTFIEDLLDFLPEQLGIDKIIPGCEVVDLDPLGVGLGVLPRFILCRINAYYELVFYRGNIGALAITDLVSVAHIRDANLYEVLGISGSGGTSVAVPHDLLSATHTDTDPQAVSTGSVIYGDATSEWTELVHPGAANRVLQSTAAIVGWSANAVTFPAAGAVPVGTGANTQVAYWIGANTLAGDAGMIYNAATDALALAGSIGIGVLVPGNRLDIESLVSNPSAIHIAPFGLTGGAYITSLGPGQVYFTGGGERTVGQWTVRATLAAQVGAEAGAIRIYANGGLVVGNAYVPTERARFDSSGRIVFGNLGVLLGGTFFGVVSDNANRVALVVRGTAAQVRNLQQWQDSTSAVLSVITNAGWLGVGTSTVDRLIHGEVSDAVTAATTFAQRLSHITSGAATANFGTGTEHELEDTGGANRIATTLETYWTNAAAANFSSAYEINVSSNTAMLEMVRMNGLNTQPVVVWNNGEVDVDFRIAASGLTNALFIRGSDGLVGINMSAPTAQFHIDQSAVGGVIPVLALDQADLSEEFIDFICASTGAGDPVDTATVVGATYARLRVAVNGTFKYLQLYNA